MIDELNPHIDVGDVVVLASGGPPMTVTAVEDDSLCCIWHGEYGEMLDAKMPRACVRVEDGVLRQLNDEDDE